MAYPQSSPLLLVCLSCLSLLNNCYAADPEPLSPSKSSSTLQDIKEFCTDMPIRYPRLCIDSLKSDPRSFKVFFGILPNISMDIAMANATAVRNDIQNALETERKNAAAEGFLRLCTKRFDTAIENIRTAMPSYKFPMEPFGSPIDGLLSSAEGYVSDCRNKLKNHGLQLALLPKIETVKRLIIVAADLIRNEEV